jgi:hypothetical protein
MNEGKKLKSKLVPIGIILILLGLFLPRQLANIAQPMDASAIRSILFISTDLFRLCFFVGLICAIIGALRNRKLKKQLALQEKVEK